MEDVARVTGNNRLRGGLIILNNRNNRGRYRLRGEGTPAPSSSSLQRKAEEFERQALTASDNIMAENLRQLAEHWRRMAVGTT